jgi:hypothetical protein
MSAAAALGETGDFCTGFDDSAGGGLNCAGSIDGVPMSAIQNCAF